MKAISYRCSPSRSNKPNNKSSLGLIFLADFLAKTLLTHDPRRAPGSIHVYHAMGSHSQSGTALRFESPAFLLLPVLLGLPVVLLKLTNSGMVQKREGATEGQRGGRAKKQDWAHCWTSRKEEPNRC